MSCKKVMLGLIVSGLVTAFVAGTAMAQTSPPAGGPGAATTGGGRGGRGGFNMMDLVKTQLAPTDEEWTVLQPKVEKVASLSRELMSSRMSGFRGGRGGRNGGGGGDNAAPAQAPSDLQEKTTALRTTLDNKDADPKDIAAKVAALRDARERTKADLAKAQGELKELLTARQEAQLVLMGMLD